MVELIPYGLVGYLHSPKRDSKPPNPLVRQVQFALTVAKSANLMEDLHSPPPFSLSNPESLSSFNHISAVNKGDLLSSHSVDHGVSYAIISVPDQKDFL